MSKEPVPDSLYVEESVRIVREAEKEGLYLRILGSLAIHLHCPGFEELHFKMERMGPGKNAFTDIDFMAYKKQAGKIRDFFEKKLGFRADPHVLYFSGGSRLIYYDPSDSYYVDVFFDKLDYSHPVNFGKLSKGRLELDSPTITLADLVLEKTQIHEINEKDIKDLVILFAAHGCSTEEQEDTINGKYVAEVLANDWGFWYDATSNLEKVKGFVPQYKDRGILTEKQAADVLSNVDDLLSMIEAEPKSKSWKRRSKKGTAKQWWQDVEEVHR
ncbi:MAG: hypothetical protein ACP6KW_05495 [Candidatus Thorarchaeota archaeon]